MKPTIHVSHFGSNYLKKNIKYFRKS